MQTAWCYTAAAHAEIGEAMPLLTPQPPQLPSIRPAFWSLGAGSSSRVHFQFLPWPNISLVSDLKAVIAARCDNQGVLEQQ